MARPCLAFAFACRVRFASLWVASGTFSAALLVLWRLGWALVIILRAAFQALAPPCLAFAFPGIVEIIYCGARFAGAKKNQKSGRNYFKGRLPSLGSANPKFISRNARPWCPFGCGPVWIASLWAALRFASLPFGLRSASLRFPLGRGPVRCASLWAAVRFASLPFGSRAGPLAPPCLSFGAALLGLCFCLWLLRALPAVF